MSRVSEEITRQRKELVFAAVKKESQGIRQSEIAEELGFETRTVYNYLVALETEGKIYKDDRTPNWHLDPDFVETRLQSVDLTNEQAFVLYLAVRLLVKQSDKRNDSAESALHKLADALKSTFGISDEIREASYELVERDHDDKYHNHFTKIISAYLRHSSIKLTYQSQHSEQPFTTQFDTYRIEPSSIGYSTYLIGYSSHVDAVRTYKLERVVDVEVIHRSHYDIPKEYRGLKLLRSAWSIIMGPDKVKVVLRFSPRVKKRVLETEWHPLQEEPIDDPEKAGWLRWQVEVADTIDMQPWVRGWGADVEVLEPAELRESMINHVKRSAKSYQITAEQHDPYARLLRLWGKTTAQPELFHPALYHIIDVANIAYWLLSRHASPRWRMVLEQTLACDADGLQEWLPFIIALHDIGKISVPFQAQNKGQKDRLSADGFDFGRYDPISSHKELHHTLVGYLHLENSQTLAQFPTSLRKAILRMVAGHHGRYQMPESRHRRDWDSTLAESSEWAALREQAVALLKKQFFVVAPPRWQEPANISAAIAMLNGFAILCDWLGSDKAYFEPKESMGLLDYLWHSRQQAYRRLESADFFRPISSSVPTRFVDLFGFAPRPMQAAIDEIPDTLLEKATLTIIEDQTGSGKTEAALALAHRIGRIRGTDELYIALPTTATSNKMFERTQKFLREQLNLDHQLVKLVHGQDYTENELRLKFDEVMENGEEAHPSLAWFAPKKQALLAPFGVGTIDQAEMTALNVKHNALRQIGLAGKVVILDEVHAYDSYMMTIIERMLRWFAEIGTSVILLSATLPSKKRKSLTEAYLGDSEDSAESPAFSTAYPALITVGANGCHAAEPSADADRAVQIKVSTLHQTETAEKAQWLLDQIAEGGCACWITNLVKNAQELYQAVRALDETVACTLLHARFPLEDRQKLEQKINTDFGKEGKRPHRAIVIGTQVLEQSLDLDFDLMVSDLAPIDLLLQRIGRLHRHQRATRPIAHAVPRVYVHTLLEDGAPKLGNEQYVYSPYILLKSWQEIAQREQFDLPTEYRPMIEAVYAEGKPSADHPLGKAYEKWYEKEINLSQHAQNQLTAEPQRKRAFCDATGVTYSDDEESNAWINAKTRWSEQESITILPLELSADGKTILLPNQPDMKIAIGRLATQAEQIALLKRHIRISNRELVTEIKKQDRPKLFESPLLRNCYPLWLVDGHHQSLDVYLDPQLGLV